MDPDQDLLDRLDQQEGPGPLPRIMWGGGLAAVAGAITYFTLTLQLKAGSEIAADAAILVFILSAVLLAVSHSRLR